MSSKFYLHLFAIVVVGAGWIDYGLTKLEVSDLKTLSATINKKNLLSDDLPAYRKNSKNSSEKNALKALIESLRDRQTTVDETSSAASLLAEDKDNTTTFTGILLTFLSAGYAGIVFVIHLLPRLAHRATHAVYDSGAVLEKDIMSAARSKVAQGDYAGAIAAFRKAAAADPQNRIPWVETIKIQRESLYDPAAAIATIREVLQNHVWPQDDAAYFLFRVSELYDTDMGDRDAAIEILEQVQHEFPETRHSANAANKLQEWKLEDQ